MRQVINRSKNEELVKGNQDLARIYDHVQEDQEFIEDFLDYKREYYIHQISVCPKMVIGDSQSSVNHAANYGQFTFVLQIKIPYQNSNAQTMSPNANVNVSNLSLNQNPLSGLNSFLQPNGQFSSSLPRHKSLDDTMRHRIVIYFRAVSPLLSQAYGISADL